MTKQEPEDKFEWLWTLFSGAEKNFDWGLLSETAVGKLEYWTSLICVVIVFCFSFSSLSFSESFSVFCFTLIVTFFF